MPTPHPIDEHRNDLHRACWSLGEIACTISWTVEASRGEVRIQAAAPTQAEAWRLAQHRATDHGPARRV